MFVATDTFMRHEERLSDEFPFAMTTFRLFNPQAFSRQRMTRILYLLIHPTYLKPQQMTVVIYLPTNPTLHDDP